MIPAYHAPACTLGLTISIFPASHCVGYTASATAPRISTMPTRHSLWYELPPAIHWATGMGWEAAFWEALPVFLRATCLSSLMGSAALPAKYSGLFSIYSLFSVSGNASHVSALSLWRLSVGGGSFTLDRGRLREGSITISLSRATLLTVLSWEDSHSRLSCSHSARLWNSLPATLESICSHGWECIGCFSLHGNKQHSHCSPLSRATLSCICLGSSFLSLGGGGEVFLSWEETAHWDGRGEGGRALISSAAFSHHIHLSLLHHCLHSLRLMGGFLLL